MLANNDRPDNQDEEQDEHGKVGDGETYDSSLAKLGLLERVDWGTDLTTASYVSNEETLGTDS